MATGRTVKKWVRVYVDGYNMSGYTRDIGPLATVFDEAVLTCLADPAVGVLPGHVQLSLGTLNGVFDNTATSGLHVVANSAGVKRTVTTAIGVRAAPAQGDAVFCGQWVQGAYQGAEDGGAVTATLPFENWASDASTLLYSRAWGRLLHASGAETAANSATGGVDTAASASFGGFFVYHVLAGDGTATLSVDDSADDSTYNALSGATSGAIDCSTPTSGLIALGRTATVRRYLRWQLALDTASTVTFVSAFVKPTF